MMKRTILTATAILFAALPANGAKPNIDRMAAEGMKFMDARTSSSVCTPTRYGILTGRYAWRTSLKQGVTNGHTPHLIDPKRETAASFPKRRGYVTACIGKWKLPLDNRGGSRRQNPKDKPVINSAGVLLFDMEKDAVESTLGS